MGCVGFCVGPGFVAHWLTSLSTKHSLAEFEIKLVILLLKRKTPQPHNTPCFPRTKKLSLFSLTQATKKKLRVRYVEYWVEVAKECFNIGNFNSLMAIITGLNMSPVLRMKKTVSAQNLSIVSLSLHSLFMSHKNTLPLKNKNCLGSGAIFCKLYASSVVAWANNVMCPL